MADRSFLLEVGIEDKNVEIEPPDLKPLTDSLDHLKTSVDDVTDDAKNKLESLRDQNIKIADSFRSAGDGAITAAQGIAFLVASNEEDLQRMVKVVAAIQGTFSTLRGSIDVVKGLNDALKAQRAATVAAAAANEALSASNSKVAATATTAGTAIGSKIPVIGGIVLAAAAAVAIYKVFQKESKDLAKESDDATESLGKTAEALKGIASQRISLGGNFIKQLQSLRDQKDAIDDIEGSTRRLRELEFDRTRIAKQTQIATNEILQTNENILRILHGDVGLTEQLNRNLNNHLQPLGNRIVAGEILLQQHQRIGDNLRQELALHQRNASAEQEKINKARERIRLLDDEFNKQKKLVEDSERSIGSLTAEDQLELRRLTSKQEQGGAFSTEELKRLEQLAGTIPEVKRMVDETLAARGRDQTAAVSSAFSDDGLSSRRILELQEQSTRDQQQAAQEEIQKRQAALDFQTENQRKVLELIEESLIREEQVRSRLDVLEATARRLKQQNNQ